MALGPSMEDLLASMTIDLPQGEIGGMAVERFTVTGHEIPSIRAAMHGRPITPGTYTRLVDCGGSWPTTWMSDTPAERDDHWHALLMMRMLNARRVLINGLGLGCVLQAVLRLETVEHVDVVEKDERVIQLVGSHYANEPRVTIHHADAFEQARRWPRGTTWDAA